MSIGQPFDDTMKERYVALVAAGLKPRQIAAELEFTHTTIKQHLKSDPDFAMAVEDADRLRFERFEEKLEEMALEGDNFSALKMILLNDKEGRWRDERTIRQEISGPGGGPISIVQANIVAFREALDDPATRTQALGLIDAIPGVQEQPELVEATATET